MEFTEEQEALRRVVRDFAESEIAPHAERWDAEHTFPVDVVRRMGELGLFGIPFPEEY
ncbi:MAG TPA: acyl-CoA dehydrogenase family protein, partial [Acidimicrobiales bacterium]|nr:acyl-CoA dehydrogenase family protein [Acidimicrobiales bacterium]